MILERDRAPESPADPVVARTRRFLLRPPFRYAAWIAILGVVLQLSGLLWDALLHHRDPTLAENESVFSLTNASHLLIMLGLAATTAGAIWGLFWYAVSVRGSRKGIGSAIRAVAVVLALGGAVLGVAISTGGVAGDHDHRNLAGHDDLATHIADPKLRETLVELTSLVRQSGTEHAIGRLEQIAAVDRRVLSEAHTLVHEVGRFSYGFYGSAPVAFSHCLMSFQSGCYHGVLEAYFQDNPKVTAREIAGLCDATLQAGSASFVRFQCLHGLGHGVTLFYSHDVLKALRTCDVLAADWDRSSCYGGVFMENVIFNQNPRHPAGHDDRAHKTFLRKDEPLYPCTILADKYLRECYLMQTSAILWFNGYNFEHAFGECAKAPGDYISICYQSLGRDIAGYTIRDQERSLELCGLGAERWRSWCDVGVVKNLIDVAANTGAGIEYCEKVPKASRIACAFAVGEQAASLHSEPEPRAAECAKLPRAIRAACRRGAQLPD